MEKLENFTGTSLADEKPKKFYHWTAKERYGSDTVQCIRCQTESSSIWGIIKDVNAIVPEFIFGVWCDTCIVKIFSKMSVYFKL